MDVTTDTEDKEDKEDWENVKQEQKDKADSPNKIRNQSEYLEEDYKNRKKNSIITTMCYPQMIEINRLITKIKM